MTNLSVIILTVFFFTGICAYAQESSDTIPAQHPHVIGVYVGLFEFNINYERNIFQHPKSYSNIRFGFGYWTDLQNEGNYINTSVVHLLGKRNAHAELNLGFKLIISGARSGVEGPQSFLIPDVYFGFRYEKPEGGEVYRVGVGYPGLIMLGGAIKF